MDWIIIRTYQDRFWAEEDSLKLHSFGIESKMEEVSQEERTPELLRVGWIRLLVKGDDLERADQILTVEESAVEAVLEEDTPGARKMLLGGVACMLGLLVSLSPNGGPVEGIAWLTMGVGAFQFMRGMYEQREEEKEILEEDQDYYEDDEDLNI